MKSEESKSLPSSKNPKPCPASAPEDEHDRYRRFVEHIDLLTTVNDPDLEGLISLALSEPELSTRGAELGLVADLATLTSDQREDLLEHTPLSSRRIFNVVSGGRACW